MWPETPIQLMGYSKYHPFIIILRQLQKYSLKASDAVASLLPNNKDYLSKMANKELKWSYLPNGINETKVERYNKYDLPGLNLEGKFVVGYTGTIGYANALDILVKVILKLKDNHKIHFLIVGDGYFRSNYQKCLAGCKNVTFIPKIPKLEVPSLLLHLDLCFIAWHRSKLYDYGVSANKIL